MNFLEELRWRGMLQDYTPGVEELLAEGPQTGYIGFDPTAPSLTIGNYVQIMLLKLWQRAGHRPIMLMGGATGRIGDPSGRDQERELKSYDELDANLNRQILQAEKLLDFTGPNPAILVNNLNFYWDMNVLDFLRDVGKTLTVNYMLSKESVQKRMDSGMSFTELSYQLLQGYDFQVLYQQHNCKVQMGGSDQWGNITTGTEFVRRNLGEKAYAVTTPLLTKADGTKFGKSSTGNLWLDPELTTPYQFYQFWVRADDADIPKYIRYFTLRPREEVEALEAEHKGNPRALKQALAEELTVRIHGQQEYAAVQRVSELLYGNQGGRDELLSLPEKSLQDVAGEIPTHSLPRDVLAGGVNIVDLLTERTGIVNSKGDARRAIQGNAVSINKEKVADLDATVSTDALLHGKYVLVENGRKNKYMVVVE